MVQSFDESHMKRAIALAAQPIFSPHPNPRVGCVIVDGDHVIAEGFHAVAGGAHAEVAALNNARRDVRGCTLYVTMEPCATHGRTPPCVEQIIAAGIARVVAADFDPNPVNRGQGIEQLRAAGVATKVGILKHQSRALNLGFFSRHLAGRPRVVVKIAASLDGRVATATGESQWITGAAARLDVHNYRARCDAILTGIGTVLADDPRLTCRIEGVVKQPLRIIMDGGLRTPKHAKLLHEPGDVLIAVNQVNTPENRRAIETRARVVCFDSCDTRVDCKAVIAYLAAQQINEVLVEAGPTLVGSLMQARLVDELIVYLAHVLLGDAAIGMAGLPQIKTLADRFEGTFKSVDVIGDDLRIHLSPIHVSSH